MRRTTARRAAILGSTALLLMGPAVAIAQADPAPAPGIPVELANAVARDLKLSPQEYLQRADVAQKLVAFADTARAQFGEVFAGSWLDEHGQGVVALADGPGKAAAQSAVHAAGFVVKDVKTSEKALQGQLQQFGEWKAGQPASVAAAIRSVAIDVVNNALAVHVDAVAGGLQLPSFIDPARIFHMQPATFGEPGPTADAIAGALAPNALAGGDAYASKSGNMSMRCSLGFNGTLNGRVVNISAGHCNPNIPASGTAAAAPVHELAQFEALGPKVGSFLRSRLDNHDWSIIAIDDAAKSRFENNAVRVPGNVPVGIDGTARPVVGAPVCKSGARTGFSCGVVSSVDQDVSVGDRTLTDSFSTNICALPGDSGGAVVSGNKALGVSSASSVAEYPICEIPNFIGGITGDQPQLFAMSITTILADNPGLQVRTN